MPLLQYRLTNHQLSTAERVRKFDAELDRLAAEGWQIHTCDTSTHPDVQILWQRPVPAPAQPAAEQSPEPQAAADPGLLYQAP
jgi:hypothetical protein